MNLLINLKLILTKNSSDLIFEFSYINEEILNYKSVKNLPLKMDVYLKDGMYTENLSKALISICVKLSTDISNTNCSENYQLKEIFGQKISNWQPRDYP